MCPVSAVFTCNSASSAKTAPLAVGPEVRRHWRHQPSSCVPHRHAPLSFKREGKHFLQAPLIVPAFQTQTKGTGPASPATLSGVSDSGTGGVWHW